MTDEDIKLYSAKTREWAMKLMANFDSETLIEDDELKVASAEIALVSAILLPILGTVNTLAEVFRMGALWQKAHDEPGSPLSDLLKDVHI